MSVLLPIVKLAHLAYWSFIAIGTFVAKHADVRWLIIFFCVLTYYFWLAFKVCPFTIVERYLGEEETQYGDGRSKSFITSTLESTGLTEEIIEHTFLLIILAIVVINMYRIRWYR